MAKIKLGHRMIGDGHPVFIIAEVGVNHNGDIDIARRMIDIAATCGVNCVKFQTFSAEEFCNSPDEIYEYISQGKVVRESMLDMFKRLELVRSDFEILFSHARQQGIEPLSTPADRAAIDLLDRLDAQAYKIGSDDLIYTQLLDYVARKNKPIILSTGMAGHQDIARAVDVVINTGNKDIVILHCVSLYPTPLSEVNLRRISSLRAAYPQHVIGFSDHTDGITAALGSVALGACVVEKHFTLDRNLPGPDHRFSADPVELKKLVQEIRSLEVNLGLGEIKPAQGEAGMAKLAHRSIVAARNISAGQVIEETDLAYRRPGTGLPPYASGKIVGKRSIQPIASGALITLEAVEEVS